MIVHVHPNAVDLPDIWHSGAQLCWPRIEAPEPNCALCRADLCVQRLDPESQRIVVHGRSEDA